VRGDCVVQSGQQTTLCSKSKICVQAFTKSVVWIRPPAPASYAAGRRGQGDVRRAPAKP
jgi:hypothetical protein